MYEFNVKPYEYEEYAEFKPYNNEMDKITQEFLEYDRKRERNIEQKNTLHCSQIIYHILTCNHCQSLLPIYQLNKRLLIVIFILLLIVLIK